MSILLPAHKITPPDWMRDPDLITVLDTLNKDDTNARMVGGCIRNQFFNKDVYDVDIACVFKPEETTEKCTKAGIKIIPTGIKHGTVTAHINGRNFEITTLRHDINPNGRHADVEFTATWEEDAKRRDFTINALYADRDGSIYDPLGHGLSDLQNHIVRFIGDPETRIKEDFLRILRFFRFYADYHDGSPHPASMAACSALKDGIKTLSDERIYDELTKMLALDHADRAIGVMHDAGIFGIKDTTSHELKALIALQNQLEKRDIATRYNITLKSYNHIKNKSVIKFIEKINEFIANWDEDILKALYNYDRDIVIQGLLTLKAKGDNISDMIIADAISRPAPEIPIIAADIMTRLHLKEGPEVGRTMKQAEALWIASDFKLTRDEILNKL